MALDNVTSHFSTILEPIASASFLSSLSIIHANTYCTQTKLFVKAVNSALYGNCKASKTYRNPRKCLLKQEKLERGLYPEGINI